VTQSRTNQAAVSAGTWPALPLVGWKDTRDTLHMWTQIVGKIRLGLMPMMNHWWQAPLYVSSQGLTTALMPYGDRGLEMEFDFLRHILEIRTTEGASRDVRLEPRSVADFYAETMARMAELDMPVKIHPRPIEVEVAIPFVDDHQHHSYDAEYAHRFWQSLVHANRLFTEFGSGWVGKASPINFWWGGFDLAGDRFSGRKAPVHPGGIPNCPDYVQWEAFSHEVCAYGYWPDGGDEGAFYAYVYPAPAGYTDWPVEPGPAYYDPNWGDFLLPYQAVRTADDPDAMVKTFLRSTYEAAAELGAWDRRALER
jgi:hypothetical protein